MKKNLTIISPIQNHKKSLPFSGMTESSISVLILVLQGIVTTMLLALMSFLILRGVGDMTEIVSIQILGFSIVLAFILGVMLWSFAFATLVNILLHSIVSSLEISISSTPKCRNQYFNQFYLNK